MQKKETDLSFDPVLRRRLRITETLQGNAVFVRQPDPKTGRIIRFTTPLFLASATGSSASCLASASADRHICAMTAPDPVDRHGEADEADQGDAEFEDHDDEASDHPAGSPLRRLRRRRKVPRRRLSQILDEIGADTSRARISVADLLTAMSGRAIGALLLLFALPNVLPAPPGTSAILGMPLVYLAAQMMLGRMPWLPAFIANRSMAREDFVATISRATPILARAEKLLKPRLSFFVHNRAERVIGALCLVLAIVLLLPIPLGNMLPALAIALIALGVLERDGVWVLIGIAVGALSMFIVAGVLVALAKATIFLIVNAF